MDRTAARITDREAETTLSTLGDEVFEQSRVAMASADKALIGQLVRTSHAIGDAERTLGTDVSAPLRPET